MIYTIGHEKNYLEAIEEYGSVKKLGRDMERKSDAFPNGYPGGYAFKSVLAANRRIEEAYPDSGFAVFGVKADWEKDTVPSDAGWWHNLINTSEIVPL